MPEQDAPPDERPPTYRRLFDSVPICLIEVDTRTEPPRIVAANGWASRLGFGHADSLPGQPLDSLIPPAGARPLRRLLAEACAAGGATVETAIVRRDGSRFAARVWAERLAADEAGRILLIIEDVDAEHRSRAERDAIDEDRRRIAHELHDVLAQNLAALRLRASRWPAMVDKDPVRLRRELQTMLAELRTDIAEARRAIFALRPITLDDDGFRATLEGLVREMQDQYRFRVRLRLDPPEPRPPQRLELPLLRMVQEALNNAGRHAAATTVWLDLVVRPGSGLRLTVRDNGVGFDSTALPKGHYGLLQMRERAAGHGGSCLVDSQPGHGTTVQIELPLPIA